MIKSFFMNFIFYKAIIGPISQCQKKLLFRFNFFKKRVKIVGSSKQGSMLSKEFSKNWYFGYRVVKKKPETLFIASRGLKFKTLQKYLNRYTLYIEEIYTVPYLEDINFTQSKIIELFNVKTSLIKIENNLLKKSSLVIKIVFEKIAVLLSLPFFAILHLLILIVIRLDSEGEAIFKQKRVGKNRRIFECYKYRTMKNDSEKILQEYLKRNPQEVEHYKMHHKYRNDPRVTKVGKILRRTSLDELPQLLNILKGDMSLVGPRPYIPSEIKSLGGEADMIFRVKPGITGLWQVSGRSNLSFRERVKLDVWYIQNWSLWMDIVIIIKTIKVVLFKTGAR